MDVAVVGGGPAGASAARAAARGGADPVFVERGVPREDREGLGPDSTDAAALINYWLDLAELSVEAFPDGVVLRELDRAVFNSPNERAVVTDPGLPASYPKLGVTVQRARFDDWLVDRAVEAGATYALGTAVRAVETDLAGGPTHELRLGDGSTYQTDHLVLADGPQRPVTLRVLDRFLPEDRLASDRLAAPRANHIAYQEYRRFPPGELETDALEFWWGHLPGATSYPWIFPNDGDVARVGVTIPMGLDLADVTNPDAYRLIRDGDRWMPRGEEIVRRLLDQEFGDRYDVDADFPLVTDRGKRRGTETYPISSTRPIDSPVAANVAVAGDAMGAASPFHEGGTHVAVRSGAVAGALAARGELDRYNDAWKAAIGTEVRRNAAMAAMVRGYEPADWDRTIATGRRILERGARFGMGPIEGLRALGLEGLSLGARYMWHVGRLRGDRLPVIRASEYRY